ncbi:MAG: transposase [Deltaproteobacteria bacterium]|nr:transposase [Deltaproteobacteria bacterium]
MGRPLRYAESWQAVEVTARTIQGRFLLRPSKRLNALIAGILAVGKQRHGVRIYNFVFLSNHFHMLIAAANPRTLSRFMNFVMGSIAREAGRLHAWRGPFWGRRYRSISITDEASLRDRMRYLYEHGCKEGLVAHPALWPGLNAVEALTRGAPLEGIRIDRTALYLAQRLRRRPPSEKDFTSFHALIVDPLPCWSDLTVEQQRHLNRELVEDVAIAFVDDPRRSKKALASLRKPPHHQPRRLKQGPAPLCHSATPEGRRTFKEAYRAFVEAYRAAAERNFIDLPSLGFPDHTQVIAFPADATA